MNLSTRVTDITDAEWVLAWSVLIARRDGRPVTNRVAVLEEECGSAERALHVLTTVRYYMIETDISEAIRLANGRITRPVPRPIHSASSRARRAAPPHTTPVRAARHRRIRTAVLWAGILWCPVYVAAEIIRWNVL